MFSKPNFKPKEHLNGDSIKHKRGRPKSRKDEYKVSIPVKLSPACYDFVMSYQNKRYDRSLSDTILRMAREGNFKAIDLTKKVEALQKENERLQLMNTSNSVMVPVTNKS